MQRIATDLLIVTILVAFVIDTTPMLGPLKRFTWIQNRMYETLQWFGVWQGRWCLFAPDPFSLNRRVSARMIFLDPETGRMHNRTYKSPQWNNITIWEKKRVLRMDDYVDAVRDKKYQILWEPFAEYLAETRVLVVNDATGETVLEERRMGPNRTQIPAPKKVDTDAPMVTTRELQPQIIHLHQHWRKIFLRDEPMKEEVKDLSIRQIPPGQEWHWLLGERLKSTLSKEYSAKFYTWNRPQPRSPAPQPNVPEEQDQQTTESTPAAKTEGTTPHHETSENSKTEL